MKNKIKVNTVILSGGSGSRLWPLSREDFPKQFIKIDGVESLFHKTLQRINNSIARFQKVLDFQKNYIISNDSHKFLLLDLLKEFADINTDILFEPVGKNTAAALTLAALAMDKESVMIVTPSDHSIKNEDNFSHQINQGIQLAHEENIVVLGINPTSPETGFGYIKYKDNNSVTGEFNVENFIEKPSYVQAKKYFQDKHYLWNSGIFILKSKVWLKAIAYFDSEVYKSVKEVWDRRITKDNVTTFRLVDFEKIKSNSIDYAVMQNCPGSSFKIKVLPLDCGWADLGSWDAVSELAKKDKNNNIFEGDVIALDVNNSQIRSMNRLVAVNGVEDLIVIDTIDALLISKVGKSQNIKKLFNLLKNKDREELKNFIFVHRPWGWFKKISEGRGFKVKHIHLKPGASISLQLHKKRSEHWVVVSGKALVVCGNNEFTLKKNESTYIPVGQKHRLSNPFKMPLEIIETQSGDYLGEDDILRFDDEYGRA